MEFLKDLGSAFYKERSFLSAEDIVHQKRKRKRYSFDKLPPLALIVLDQKLPKIISKPFAKKLKGFPGTGYFLNKNAVLCTPFGNGAPALLLLLEELRVLGVQKFIFVGTAGMLDANLTEQGIFLVDKALSGVGSSFFYSENETCQPPEQLWSSQLAEELKIEKAVAWSTDSPYRETPLVLHKLKKKSVQLIDMECAAVYAFASFYNLKAACLLVGADHLTKDKWQPPKQMVTLIEVQKQLILRLEKLKSIYL